MALDGILEGTKVRRHQSFSPLRRLLASFWDRAGSQKSTETRSLAEKTVPEVTFSVIFVVILICFAFLVDFGLIFAGPDP